MPRVNIFWFRRDLRLEDNAGLYHALTSGLPVVPVFIFDTNILDKLEDRSDRRVNFIHHVLQDMQKQLLGLKTSMDVRHGEPLQVFREIIRDYDVHAVYTNHDYEPYARQRDQEMEHLLNETGIAFHVYKDQVIFEKNEVVKDNGAQYSVFTPYSKKWKALLDKKLLQPFQCKKYSDSFFQQKRIAIPSLSELGFEALDGVSTKPSDDKKIILHYHQTRDYPSMQGTTRLGIHLRFGTMSIRTLVSNAVEYNETFLNELIWREFFMQMLWHHPRLANQCYKTEYENIRWRNDENEFERWCNGTTGFPLVDAGMRELNQTGFMHNRVRMITASFLVKHLLTDWRWGEAYFAGKLLDFELSSNNGNWQWVAGCGCDAAPYFRIFNPAMQQKKFDPQLEYVRKWIPEFDSPEYPSPIVEHEFARERCLKAYKSALSHTK